MKRITVIGMGYVGLTLSVVLSDIGFKVHGVEKNPQVVEKLNQGIAHFHEKSLDKLLCRQLKQNLKIDSDMPEEKSDVYIIAVGSPVDKQKVPVLDYIKAASKQVGDVLHKDALVVLRSTVPVGTTRNVVIPILEEQSKLKAGKDFMVAFVPERTIEGKAIPELRSNPQIIGGFDEKSTEATAQIFIKLTPVVVRVSSLEAAEMIKILDNTYRDVRFAYANEVALVSESMGLDAVELIRAANTHYPRNSIPLPSPGVGGACLSKDPYILSNCAAEKGYNLQLISQARKLNEGIISDIIDRMEKKLSTMNKKLQDSKIFLVGFAFKGHPETSDTRDSTSLWILDELKKRNVSNIAGYDPVVSKTELEKLGLFVQDYEQGFKDADIVMFINNHDSYSQMDFTTHMQKMKKPSILYDAWRMLDKEYVESIDGIHYMSVGL